LERVAAEDLVVLVAEVADAHCPHLGQIGRQVLVVVRRQGKCEALGRVLDVVLARLAALAAREQHNGEEGDDDRENRGREPSGSATPGYDRLVAGVTTVGTVDVPDVPGGDS